MSKVPQSATGAGRLHQIPAIQRRQADQTKICIGSSESTAFKRREIDLFSWRAELLGRIIKIVCF